MSDAGHSMGSNEHVEHPRRPIEEGIYTMGGPGVMVDESVDSGEMPLLAPAWQIFPLMGNEGRLMYNEYADRHRRRGIDTMLATKRAALTEVLYGFADHHHFYQEPSSIMMYPVFDSFENENNIVGFVSITFSWIGTFWNILPENVRGINAVIETSTGQTTSYRVDGKFVSYSMSRESVSICSLPHHLSPFIFFYLTLRSFEFTPGHISGRRRHA